MPSMYPFPIQCLTGKIIIPTYNVINTMLHTMYNVNDIGTCKIEDATKNEKVKVEPVSSQYIQDDKIIIVCDSEYQMANVSDPIIVRICMSDRTWSGIDPRCVKSKTKLSTIIIVDR